MSRQSPNIGNAVDVYAYVLARSDTRLASQGESSTPIKGLWRRTSVYSGFSGLGLYPCRAPSFSGRGITKSAQACIIGRRCSSRSVR